MSLFRLRLVGGPEDGRAFGSDDVAPPERLSFKGPEPWSSADDDYPPPVSRLLYAIYARDWAAIGGEIVYRFEGEGGGPGMPSTLR